MNKVNKQRIRPRRKGRGKKNLFFWFSESQRSERWNNWLFFCRLSLFCFGALYPAVGFPPLNLLYEINEPVWSSQPSSMLSSANEPPSLVFISAVSQTVSSVCVCVCVWLSLSHSPHTPCSTCGKTPHCRTCSSGPGLPAASSPALSGLFTVTF